MKGSRTQRSLGACALALACLAALARLPGPAHASRSGEKERRPNVLIIITDDQRLGGGSMAVMRETRRRIGGRGVEFTSAYASDPLCCPARATIMSGKYSHNHGVVDNFTAGEFDIDKSIQAALGKAGYTRSIFGKYLNHWTVKPPRFDHWLTFAEADPGDYRNVEYIDQDKVRRISGYTTDVLRRGAIRRLKSNEKHDATPWLMLVAPNAPHAPYIPPFRYRGTEVNPWDYNPAVEELDRTDKPQYVRDRSTTIDNIDRVRTRQLRTLMAVDDLVEKIDEALGRLEERRNTLVFFVSDNGYAWGEHGLIGSQYSKNHPYSASVRIPLMMRWPKEIEPKTSRRMVTNVDIAATIYDAAGVKPPLRLDGRSLLSSDWSRRFVLLEHALNPNLPTIPAWRSVRSKADQYIEYLDTEGDVTFREYYDLKADPWQLENLLGNLNPLDDPDVSDEHDLVTRLSTCRGTSGRNPCP